MFEERMQVWRRGLISGAGRYLAEFPETKTSFLKHVGEGEQRRFKFFVRHGQAGRFRAEKVREIASALENSESIYVLGMAILIGIGGEKNTLQRYVEEAILLVAERGVELAVGAKDKDADEWEVVEPPIHVEMDHFMKEAGRDDAVSVENMQAVRQMLDNCKAHEPEDLRLFERTEGMSVSTEMREVEETPRKE